MDADTEVENNNKNLAIEKFVDDPDIEFKKPSVIKQWTIVFACCWINIAVFAMLKSSGVLYLAILENFEGSTSADASWQITLINSISAITSLPAGFLSHYFTERSIVSVGILITSSSITTCYFSNSIFTINILLGLFQGAGLGLIFGQLPAIITQYFDPESRAAAVGVSFAGSTIGSICSPLLFDQLLQSFSLQETCLIMGIISLTSIFGAVLLIPHPKSRVFSKEEKFGKSSSFVAQVKDDFKVMRNTNCVLICISYSTHYLSSITVMMLLADFAIRCGLTHKESVLLLSFISVGNLLGRLSPLISNLLGLPKIGDRITYIASMVLLPLVYVLFPVLGFLSMTAIPLFVQFLILVLLLGYFSSFQLVLAPVLLAEYLGSSKTAVAFGLVNFSSGILSFSRPLIIEVVGGSTNNYNKIFITFAVFPLISAGLWMISFFKSRKNVPKTSDA